jgi:hypothetical protein
MLHGRVLIFHYGEFLFHYIINLFIKEVFNFHGIMCVPSSYVFYHLVRSLKQLKFLFSHSSSLLLASYLEKCFHGSK